MDTTVPTLALINFCLCLPVHERLQTFCCTTAEVLQVLRDSQESFATAILKGLLPHTAAGVDELHAVLPEFKPLQQANGTHNSLLQFTWQQDTIGLRESVMAERQLLRSFLSVSAPSRTAPLAAETTTP
jgi:hypothetical protein